MAIPLGWISWKRAEIIARDKEIEFARTQCAATSITLIRGTALHRPGPLGFGVCWGTALSPNHNLKEVANKDVTES